MEYRCGMCGHVSNTRCGHHELKADKELFEKRWNDTVTERDAALLQLSEEKKIAGARKQIADNIEEQRDDLRNKFNHVEADLKEQVRLNDKLKDVLRVIRKDHSPICICWTCETAERLLTQNR